MVSSNIYKQDENSSELLEDLWVEFWMTPPIIIFRFTGLLRVIEKKGKKCIEAWSSLTRRPAAILYIRAHCASAKKVLCFVSC